MTIPRQDFEIFWSRLQQEISAGDTVRNWTKYNGYLRDSFTIHRVDSKFVEVDAPNAYNIQHVTKNEFEKVYDLWDAYNEGDVPRWKLADITRFSKYTISILNHLLNDR